MLSGWRGTGGNVERNVERVGGEGEGQRAPIGQVAFASFVGTAIEWYGYFLYGRC